MLDSIRTGIALIACIAFGGCREGAMDNEKKPFANNLPAINLVKGAQWDALSKKKIFFGHQSVGFNIIDGMAEVMRSYPVISLRITRTSDPLAFDKPVFAHTSIGTNGQPLSKISQFDSLIENGLGNKFDIAFFKMCFIDFNGATDVTQLFQNYSRTMDALAAKFPHVRFIHCTVPLTVRDNGVRGTIKRLLGRDVNDVNNEKRGDFNDLMREKYRKEGSLFDLAEFESTYPDNSREVFRHKDKTIYFLVKSYSSDGAHLNEVGKRLLAEKLLVFLALR